MNVVLARHVAPFQMSFPVRSVGELLATGAAEVLYARMRGQVATKLVWGRAAFAAQLAVIWKLSLVQQEVFPDTAPSVASTMTQATLEQVGRNNAKTLKNTKQTCTLPVRLNAELANNALNSNNYEYIVLLQSQLYTKRL